MSTAPGSAGAPEGLGEPSWAGSPGERAVMHVLATEVPRIVGPVAEAALSPLLARVDRALDVASQLASSVGELVTLAGVVAARVDGLARLLEKLAGESGPARGEDRRG